MTDTITRTFRNVVIAIVVVAGLAVLNVFDWDDYNPNDEDIHTEERRIEIRYFTTTDTKGRETRFDTEGECIAKFDDQNKGNGHIKTCVALVGTTVHAYMWRHRDSGGGKLYCEVWQRVGGAMVEITHSTSGPVKGWVDEKHKMRGDPIDWRCLGVVKA
jgi:hypothetical protein